MDDQGKFNVAEKIADLEREVARLREVNEHWHVRINDLKRDNESLERQLAEAERDRADWRKGVLLIVSALGEKDPMDLSCARLSEVALNLQAERDKLRAQLVAAREAISSVTKVYT